MECACTPPHMSMHTIAALRAMTSLALQVKQFTVQFPDCMPDSSGLIKRREPGEFQPGYSFEKSMASVAKARNSEEQKMPWGCAQKM
jgi:hypothetical protein